MTKWVLILLLFSALLSPFPTYAQALSVSLKGTKESLLRQNRQADQENLTRLRDDKHLERFKKLKLLVKLPETTEVQIDPRLEEKLRFARPWTRQFLLDLGKIAAPILRKPLQVNSAVRTVVYQEALRKRNPNAAPAKGLTASSHLAGSTVDIAKLPMSEAERHWMRGYLLAFEQAGLIEATEEESQAVFHVMVFKKYGQARRAAQR